MGRRYAAVRTTDDDDFLSRCWVGVLRHFHARFKFDRGYLSSIRTSSVKLKIKANIAIANEKLKTTDWVDYRDFDTRVYFIQR